MAIYNKPVRLLMQDMADAFDLPPGQSFSRQDAIAWFAQHYPNIKKGTITAHLIRLSINAPSRRHYNPKVGDDDLFFQIDSNRFRRYDPQHDPAPIHDLPDTPRPEESDRLDRETTPESTKEFAYETDLRDYLAQNLSMIEPGLQLYADEDITGVEFPVGGRFIDLLAVDAQGDFVVIELKVSRAYDRVIGQLLRYMAWIQANLTESHQTVRGIIIARTISEDLILACSLLPNITLLEYELSLTLQPVDPVSGAHSQS